MFRSIDNTSLDDAIELKCEQVKVGDEISTTIPKSLTKCKPKIAIVKCGEKDINCQPVAEANKTILYGCVYEVDNDNKAFANIVVKNKSIVPSFTLGYSVTDEDGVTDSAEIFEFEGGTFDELIEYIEGNSIVGYEITSYGLKIFVDSKYAGETIYLNSDKTIFLLGTTYCMAKNSEYGLSYCIPTSGCYQILLYKIKDDGTEEVLAYSHNITVVDFEPYKTSIVAWYENGFYHRERLNMWADGAEIQIEETEEVQSDGTISITDTIIRAEEILHVDITDLSTHKKYIKLLKGGVRFNGRKAKLRGEYTLEQVRKRYVATGTLNFESEDIIGIENCEQECNNTSTITYDYK